MGRGVGFTRRAWSAVASLATASAALAALPSGSALAAPVSASAPTPSAVARDATVSGVYTPFSHDWVNSDGTHTRVIGDGPIFYQDSAGSWHNIDVHPALGAGGLYSPTADNSGVSFANVSSANVVSAPTPAGAVILTHPEATPVGATVDPDGFNVDYPAALPGNEGLQERFTPNGFDETVVVPSSSAPASYQDTFVLPPGVSAATDGSSVGFYDASGMLLGTWGSAFATDAAGSVTAANLTLGSSAPGSATVAVTVPADWFSASGRSFPLTIDPTWSVNTGTEGDCNSYTVVDTYSACSDYVANDNPGGTYAGYTYMRVGTPATCSDGEVPCNNPSLYTIDRMLLKFPTDEYGDGTYCYQVTSASLSLNLEQDGLSSPAPTAHNYYLYGLSSPFGYDTNWNNQPNLDGYSPDSIDTVPDGDYSTSVTDMAQRWFDCAETNNGIEVRPDNEQDPTAYRVFYSGNYGSGYAPTLTVNYITPPSAPLVSASAGTKSMTISWQPPSDNGGGTVSEYEIAMAGQPTQYCYAPCSSAYFGNLQGNTTYTGYVYAFNQSGASPPGQASATTPVNLPSAPQNVSASVTGTTVTASWAQPADTGGAGIPITGYDVSLNGGTPVPVSGSTYSYPFTGLVVGQSYSVTVSAENELGFGPSASANATIPAQTPGPPTSVNPDEFGNVTWGVPTSNGGSPITSYTVTPYDTTSGTAVAGTPVTVCGGCTSTTITGLVDSDSYYFAVYATNAVGHGPPTNSATVVYVNPSPAESLGGGTSTDEPINQCSGSDPVDCATGDYYFTHTDDAFPGRGIPLDLSRTYNSLAAGTLGPFGYGWACAYCMSAAINSTTGVVTITQENGSQISFTPTSGGNYRTAPRVLAGLVKNSSGQYVLTRRARQILTFSSSGQLLSEADLNGHVTSLTYSGGKLAAVSDPAGRSFSFTYGSNGLVSQVTDSFPHHVSYGYDAANNLVSVTDLNGGITAFGYDSAHHLTTVTDPDNNPAITNVYDSSGRVTTQTDALNDKTTFAYNGATTTVTDPKGNVTVETYDNTVLVAVTAGYGSPQAATTRFSYTSGRVLEPSSTTDADGHTSSVVYDAAGNVLKTTDALNRSTISTYDALDDLTSVTDPMNLASTLSYDGAGNLLSVSRPAPAGQTQKTTYSYTDGIAGDVTGVTDPNHNTTSYTYDAYGDVATVTDAMGDQTTYGYQIQGDLVSSVSPRGIQAGANPAQFTTSYAYNPLGELTQTQDPLGDITAATYDLDGNLKTSTPAGKPATAYTYNAANQLVQVNQADGSVLRYGYDPNGNQTAQTDGNNNTTSYAYDPLNRLASSLTPPTTAAPGGIASTNGYDPAGNLTTVTNTSHQVTTYAYDAANQLTSTSYSDGKTPDVAYAYNADGQITSQADTTVSGFSRTYAYDSLGRLSATTDHVPLAATSNTINMTYGYDLANNVTSIGACTLSIPCYFFGRTYDAAERLSGVTDGLGDTTSFSYDADNNLMTESYPNSTTAHFAYDNADQLTSIKDQNSQGTSLVSETMARNQDGTVHTATFNPAGETGGTYSYDGSDRLIQVGTDNPSEAATYSYDPANNLTHVSEPFVGSNNVAAMTNTYDAANELTVSAHTADGGGIATGRDQFSFDAQGDRTSQTFSYSGQALPVTAQFGYNQANELTSYDGPPLSTLGQKTTPPAHEESFSYDASGLLTGLGWNLTGSLPTIVTDSTGGAFITGPNGLPVEEITYQGQLLYYYQDAMGSTTAVSDRAGGVLATFNYDSYGNEATSNAAVVIPFGFEGQYTDPTSDLVYMRARWYDPTTGQFLNRDQVKSAPAYLFGNGDPVNETDWSGNCPKAINQAQQSCLPPGAVGPCISSPLYASLIGSWGLLSSGDSRILGYSFDGYFSVTFTTNVPRFWSVYNLDPNLELAPGTPNHQSTTGPGSVTFYFINKFVYNVNEWTYKIDPRSPYVGSGFAFSIQSYAATGSNTMDVGYGAYYDVNVPSNYFY